MLRERSEYWLLVEELMRFGWYREQPAQTKILGDGEWSFRSGHTLDEGVDRRRRILAPSELEAMRLLLEDLRRVSPARR